MMLPPGIHPMAAIGEPPEHRDWPADWQPGIPYFPAIDKTARVEAFVTVDAGTFRPTRIGARSWLMKKVHVGHDAIIGDDCELAPLTSVGGEVVIGNGVKVGQGATFRPRVSVGNGARIGMGAVVVTDVPGGETWVGNPARPIQYSDAGSRLPEGKELANGDSRQEGEREGAEQLKLAEPESFKVIDVLTGERSIDVTIGPPIPESYSGLRGL